MRAALLVLVWAAGFALMAWMMSHGPGISPDSIVYLSSAQSLLSGHGLMVAGHPMTHFPPLYPMLLASLGVVHHDLLTDARLLAAGCFATNVVLVGAAVYFATERQLRAAVCAVLLFVVSATVLDLHAMAWSEAPFFGFTLLGLLLLAAERQQASRALLTVAALSLGLAAATRYVGLVLLPVLCVVLWFMGRRSWRERLRDSVAAVPFVVAPLAIWMFRNARVAHDVTDRHLGLHPVSAAALAQLVTTLSDAFFPVVSPLWLKLVILSVLVLVLLLLWWRTPRSAADDSSATLGRSLPTILLGFAGSYVGFLLLSISVADASTPLDDRLLFPVVGVVIVAATIIGERFVRARPERWSRWALLAVVILSLGLRIQGAEVTMARVHRDGSGYASEAWQDSPAIARLAALPTTTLIYSNASEAVGYLTERQVLAIPDSLLPETLLPNPRYVVEMGALCWRVSEGRAVAAYLTTEGIGDPDEKAHLERLCSFPSSATYPDGTIYGSAPPPQKQGTRQPERDSRTPEAISAGWSGLAPGGGVPIFRPPRLGSSVGRARD